MIHFILDIDFHNAAGFQGVKAESSEGQFVAHYLSHALLFCIGALIEPHVMLTPALCVIGERYKFDVFAGTHKFLLNTGIQRTAQHLCLHKDYNHTQRWTDCSPLNMALVVLDKPFSFHKHEGHAEYIINRLRYGPNAPRGETGKCHYYGFGSRRNGYLLPLLIELRKVEVVILPESRCLPMWRHKDQHLCIQETPCKSEKFGALCPDDVGSVIECSGFAVGMMVSRLIDRPCGVGFLDLNKNLKFLTCGVDDARDVILSHDMMTIDYVSTVIIPETPKVITVTASSKEYEDYPSVPPEHPTEHSIEHPSEHHSDTETSTTSTTTVQKHTARMLKGKSFPRFPISTRKSSQGYGLTTTPSGAKGFGKPMDYYGYL